MKRKKVEGFIVGSSVRVIQLKFNQLNESYIGNFNYISINSNPNFRHGQTLHTAIQPIYFHFIYVPRNLNSHQKQVLIDGSPNIFQAELNE